MKKYIRSFMLALVLILFLPLFSTEVLAADLDRILDYEITVDVNQDGTLNMLYHIEWKVLDSTSEGPLEWVKIGIPNKKYVSMSKITKNIKSIKYYSDGGSYARIDFDRKYKKNEVVVFEFKLVQDYMYQMNQFVDGETVYGFTPGWFTDAKTDKLVIRWNADKVKRTEPDASTVQDDGKTYYVWTKENLGHSEKYPVQIVYDNGAFRFDPEKTREEGDNEGLVIVIVLILVIGGPLFLIFLASALSEYNGSANMSTVKKITRTKVVYYPECPGCGGTRPEGASNCPYCGRSFIKSEEVIEEKDIPKEEKAIRKQKTDGLYPYVSAPNTYVRVHVTHVPVPRSTSSSHSSCAHSSCACACACACAGGGRAGCSVKDFYNTNLKLKYLRKGQN